MARPPKYETPQQAAEAQLLSRIKCFANNPRSLAWVVDTATSKCHVCATPPMEVIHVSRKDGDYTIWHNRISNGLPVCKMCLNLQKIATVKEIRSYAARIMAKRKHELDSKWVSGVPEKLDTAGGNTQ